MPLIDEGTSNVGDNSITIEEFLKVTLQAGKIIQAQSMSGMKKIIKVEVDIGSEKREIAVGVAAHYKPEELIGKMVIVCTNLRRRKIGNMISNGMILAADSNQGKPVLVTVDDEVPNGAIVH